jgi:predicted dehydrogenase
MTSVQAQKPASPDVSRRDLLKGGLLAGAVSGAGLGAFYFGYEKSLHRPVRVGVIGTGDEGSVLLGAINPNFLEVRAIADIRPYNVYRAFHGEIGQPVRPGLLSVYGWKDETEARRHVKVYGPWEELLDHAQEDGLEGIILALPLFLHAPVAIAAMERGLHVLTEKLMAHTIAQCKDMARVAKKTGLLLATGHQRHYNILYAQAAEKIKRGVLGDLHYIRAQWHRSNLPGKDSWQHPGPPGVLYHEPPTAAPTPPPQPLNHRDEARGLEIEKLDKQVRQLEAQVLDRVLHTGKLPAIESLRGTAAAEMAEKIAAVREAGAAKTPAEALGYQAARLQHAKGVYERPAIEELIRWRLWDRTAAGLMAELGSHQLDAASIFVAAAHGGQKQHPLNVAAGAARSLFEVDRDCEDHVFCIIEFPAPGYDEKDLHARRKKIGVMYSSINGNGFGGYGEVVYGTKGTLILEREQTMHEPASGAAIKVSGGGAGPTLDTQASGPARALAASGPAAVSRGYAEELEHWAWCIRHPAPENQPKCGPKVALGDAVIALVTNIAARQGRRIEFKEEWFDPDHPATPEKDLTPTA